MGRRFSDSTLRDLFRHIHDGTRLRKNSIVSRFFAATEDKHADHVIAGWLRDQIVQIARLIFAEGPGGGGSSSAKRSLSIVEAVCADEAPSITSAKLGLSRSQYYRDRLNALRRVAVELQALEALSIARSEPGRDPLRLFLRRAIALVDQGFAKKAIDELNRELRSSASTSVRARLLMHISAASFQLGDLAAATEYQRASRHLAIHAGSPNADEVARGDLDFIVDSQLARVIGTPEQAQMLARFADLRSTQRVSSLESEESLVEVLIEATCSATARLRFGEARRHLDDARDLARQLANIRSDVQISLHMLSGDLSEVEHEAHYEYRTALELSLATGSAEGGVTSNIRLAEYFGRRKDEKRAAEHYRNAVRIARAIEGDDWYTGAVVYAGHALLATRYWPELDPISFEIEELCERGGAKWIRLKENQGLLLARRGHLPEAVAALSAVAVLGPHASDRLGYTRVLCHLAAFSERLGRGAESIEYARTAIAIAGDSESASLGQQLRTAFKIARHLP